MCVCVGPACKRSSTHGSSPGFKMLYADRGSSHNMNHLVTRAELEMSRLISVPSCLCGTAPFTSVATELKRRRWEGG